MSREIFDKAAATWDEQPRRLALARAIGTAIKKHLPLHGEMLALEIGCGTGLLTTELAGEVDSIMATDSSAGMLEVLDEKIESHNLANVQTARLDLTAGDLPPGAGGFDLVYSAMTLHHIRDTEELLSVCFDLLEPEGILAIADLDQEDGSFHGDMAGVEHFGFDRDRLAKLVSGCGFGEVAFVDAHKLEKEDAEGELRSYPVFLMTARKSRV